MACIYRGDWQGVATLMLSSANKLAAMNDTNSPLPTLDSTRLLARAALRRAVQGAAATA
jgi:aspartate racemase